MAELLFGERLRETEEALLHALTPGKGAATGDGTMLEREWQQYPDTDKILSLIRDHYEDLLASAAAVLPETEEAKSRLTEKIWQTAEAAVRSVLGGNALSEVTRLSYEADELITERGAAAQTMTVVPSLWGYTGEEAREHMHPGERRIINRSISSAGDSADMQKISDFFRRDSRRYDGGFKRY